MVNKVAALGALVCIVAAALSTGLLLTDEFVEVFVSLGNGETSCAIGFLGVNEAGFDASCLSVEELEASSLGGVDPSGNKVFSIEAFTAPTEEFKLLFPTQQGFYYEINPLRTRFLQCVEEGIVAECTQEAFDFSFPSFESFDEDCDAFYSRLALTHAAQVIPGVGGGIFAQGQTELNELLAQLFTLSPVAGFMEPVYDQSVFLGLLLFWEGVYDQLSPLVAGSFPSFTPLDFVNLNTSQSADNLIAFGDFVDAAGGVFGIPAIMATRMTRATEAVAAVGCGVGVNLTSCFFGALGNGAAIPNVVGENYFEVDLGATFCTIVTGVAANCDFETLATAVITALDQSLNAADNEDLETLRFGYNGALQIGTALRDGQVSILDDNGTKVDVEVISATFQNLIDYQEANSTATMAAAALKALLGTTSNFQYPATKDASFQYCTFLQSLELYKDENGDTVQQTTCSFQFFVENAAAAAASGGLDAATVSLAVSLTTLFGTCFDFIDRTSGFLLSDPNDCWKFFPAALLNLAFSGGLEDSFASFNVSVNIPGEEVFAAAADSCNDDIADLEAIGSAQAISPVGIVFLGAAAVFAVVSVAVNNRIIAGVAGGVSLLGTLLILVALITVYNAPIYASVGDGDDAEVGEIIYLAGRTVSLGLGAIAMGAIGGVIMIVSVFTFSSSDSAEAKALGAATEKPVSI